MDKKQLSAAFLQVDNSSLEAAMAQAATERTKEVATNLLNEVFKADLLVPVVPPKGVDIKKLKNMKGLPLNPVIIKNNKGDSFAPAFTSVNEVRMPERYPMLWKVPSKQVAKIAATFKPELNGIWLNPETKGLMLHQDFIKVLNDAAEKQATQIKSASEAAKAAGAPAPGAPGTKTIKMTAQQFGVFARQTVERSLLPQDIFTKKGEFMKELEERREALMLEYYTKPFKENVPYTYVEDDFSVMVLDIDDKTTAACIELPNKSIAPGIALSMYIIWNPVDEEIHYYMIEKGEPQQDNVLCNMTADRKHNELMTAPAVGSELSSVIELIQEEKEEMNM